MYKIIRILIVLCIILFFAGAAGAGVADNSLEISLIKYDPYPVSPDSDFSIWVRMKNVGDNDISDVSVEFVPKYPFSIKPGDSAVKNPGTIRKKDEIIYKFSVHADKNAYTGTNTIQIGYRIDGSFTKKEFDIEVGSEIVDAKGTVRLEKYTILPETLMPGDNATVTLTMKNSASAYTIKMDGKDYSMNSYIQSAELLGSDKIDVTSEPYFNAGIVGPGDSTELSYMIKVRNDTPDGTYFLDFNLRGSARLYSLNLKIPVKVDSSSIGISLSEAPDLNPGKIILNVANNRPSTIQAASVIPVGNATFEPAEYFIGTMEPDELFTVKFDMKASSPDNIGLKMKFKNGNNWHESEVMGVKFDASKTPQKENAGSGSLLPVMAILAGTVVLITVFFVIMRKRRAKSG